MLPLVDSSVLEANVQFEALYHDLCTTKLNPDGTSKQDARAQNSPTEVRQLQCTPNISPARRNTDSGAGSQAGSRACGQEEPREDLSL